jgi:hypothetical protein
VRRSAGRPWDRASRRVRGLCRPSRNRGPRSGLCALRRLGLASQRLQVRHAPAAISQHHRQIAEHPPRHMARTALTRTLKRIAQLGRQPDPIGTSASNDVPARENNPVPSARTSSVLTLQRPITFKVNLLSGGIGDSTSRTLPAQADVSHRQPEPLLTNRGLSASLPARRRSSGFTEVTSTNGSQARHVRGPRRDDRCLHRGADHRGGAVWPRHRRRAGRGCSD